MKTIWILAIGVVIAAYIIVNRNDDVENWFLNK